VGLVLRRDGIGRLAVRVDAAVAVGPPLGQITRLERGLPENARAASVPEIAEVHTAAAGAAEQDSGYERCEEREPERQGLRRIPLLRDTCPELGQGRRLGGR